MQIHVIGDSISVQYGPYLRRALRGMMTFPEQEDEASALRNLDKPTGANAGDSFRVLAMLRDAAACGGLDVDVLLVNCGLHDHRRDPGAGTLQVPLDAYEKNLMAIIEDVAAMRPDMIWIRTTPCEERVHNASPDMKFHRFAADNAAYNAVADRIMAAAGIPVIDLHGFTANLGSDLYCDHVHFHPAIRAQQGAFLAGWLIARFGGGVPAMNRPSSRIPGP